MEEKWKREERRGMEKEKNRCKSGEEKEEWKEMLQDGLVYHKEGNAIMF